MPFFDSIRLGSSSSADASFLVDRSLRFNGDDTYLNKTPSTLGDRKKWTWSAWVKRSKLGTVQDLFSAYHESGFYNVIRFGSDDQLNFQSNSAAIKETNRVFRDPSAWYHIVVSVNTLNTTAADRVIIYVNGSRETLATDNTVNFGVDYAMNSAQPHTIGVYANGSSYNFDGYMAEINFIDGQALTPSSFGETNSTTGQWNPKEYEGTYSKSGSASDGTTWVSGSSNNNNQVEANAFNGRNVTSAADAGSMYQTPLNGSYTVTPSTSFTVNSKLSFQMYANVANFNTYSSIYVNGSEVTMSFVTGTNGSTNDGLFESNFTGTVNNFGLASHPTSINGIAQVLVDGDVLINGFNNNGKNSFYLQFADNSGTTATTLGKDSSGQSNNYTPNNFSVSAGVNNDSVTDTPTNNFCTLNPLDKAAAITTQDGNLQIADSSTGNYNGIRASFGSKTGKFYWEIKFPNTGYLSAIGIARADGRIDNGNQPTYRIVLGLGSWYNTYNSGGVATYVNATPSGDYPSVATWSGASNYSTNDIYMIAVDFDTGKIWWGKNNSWFNNTGTANPATGTDPRHTFTTGNEWFPYSQEGDSSSCNQSYNFGQQGFAYTPPSGFKALSSANLPNPTIKLPNEHFDTKLWSGNDGSQTITYDFGPDWVWLKNRGATDNHFLTDSVRGAGLELESNTTASEVDQSSKFTGFTSTGFTLNTTDNLLNGAGNTYVGWAWNAGDTDGKTYTVKVVSDSGNKYRFDNFGTSAVTLDLAEGGTYIFNMDDSSNATHPFSIGTAANGTVYTSGITYFLDGVSKTYSQYTSGFAAASTRRLHITVPASAPVLYYWCSAHSGMGGQINTNSTLGSSNFDGTIQSTVKANTTAGFSISTYTGNGSTGATIGHGLGVKPSVIICKCRSVADNWIVYHQGLNSGVDPEDYYIFLNSTSAEANSIIMLNDTAPTSSVITFQNDSTNNLSGRTYVMYCFSEVAGYSRFGSYTGNGSSTDGAYIFLGFRPAWIMIKRYDSTGGWNMFDNKRDPFNAVDAYFTADGNSSETSGTPVLDFLSNGFKFYNSWNAANQGTMIYLAFAESPFKNSRAR